MYLKHESAQENILCVPHSSRRKRFRKKIYLSLLIKKKCKTLKLFPQAVVTRNTKQKLVPDCRKKVTESQIR